MDAPTVGFARGQCKRSKQHLNKNGLCMCMSVDLGLPVYEGGFEHLGTANYSFRAGVLSRPSWVGHCYSVAAWRSDFVHLTCHQLHSHKQET